jgi:hypothetical protein
MNFKISFPIEVALFLLKKALKALKKKKLKKSHNKKVAALYIM